MQYRNNKKAAARLDFRTGLHGDPKKVKQRLLHDLVWALRYEPI